MDQQAFELLKSMLSELGDGLKEVRNEIHQSNETLIRNTVSLEEHIKRTNLLENYVKQVEAQLKSVEAQLTHVDAHVVKVEGFMGYFKLTPKKAIVIISAFGAVAAFLIEYKEIIIKLVHNLYK